MNLLSPLRCPHGCKSIKQGFKLVRRYGPHYTPLYECLRCGQQFSGRYDSVFSGFHAGYFPTQVPNATWGYA